VSLDTTPFDELYFAPNFLLALILAFVGLDKTWQFAQTIKLCFRLQPCQPLFVVVRQQNAIQRGRGTVSDKIENICKDGAIPVKEDMPLAIKCRRPIIIVLKKNWELLEYFTGDIVSNTANIYTHYR